jgi:GTP diphosphokinase / guanosine-3',5'-bis(diphosphate) 3'-diphosphatase
VNHLIEVAHILANHGIDDLDLLCAALLHDSIEDAGVSAAEIRSRFGERVVQLVLAVTDSDTEPLWQRKLHQIERAPTLSPAAQNLRIADKISNLRGILTSPPENWSIERKLAYFGWADKVVEGCDLGLLSLREAFFEIHRSGSLTLEVQAAAVRGSFRKR